MRKEHNCVLSPPPLPSENPARACNRIAWIYSHNDKLSGFESLRLSLRFGVAAIVGLGNGI